MKAASLLVLPAAVFLGACSTHGAAHTQPGPGPSSTVDASVADASISAVDAQDAPAVAGRPVKVMIVNMSALEGTDFVSSLGLTEKAAVTGIPGGVLCNASDVCEVTLGMGYGNASTSMTTLLYRGGLNLTQTYFVIAGTAGVDPVVGTIGSVAWAQYLVDFGVSAEIDAREMPAGWPYGYLGLGAGSPGDAPTVHYGTEVVALNAALAQKAYALSKGVALSDSSQAAAFRANYAAAPANAAPTVLLCDVVSSDTWFGGTALTKRAHDWAELVTGGKATSCMSANEDNATFEVLRRASLAGKVDVARVAVLRAASDMNAPYEGLSDSALLEDFLDQGGLVPAVANLAKVAAPLVAAIVGNWSQWQVGVVP